MGVCVYIYTYIGSTGLCCCRQAFSSCREWGLFFVTVCKLLIAMASLVAEHRLKVPGPQQLQHIGSVAVALKFQSTSSAYGILQDQGSNSCPVCWQADSYPLHHWGSPNSVLYTLLSLNKNYKCDHHLTLAYLFYLKRFLSWNNFRLRKTLQKYT